VEWRVTLGQLAAVKGTDSGVKDFGNRMVSDHGKANDELKALAGSKGITLPPSDAESKKTTNDPSKLSGRDKAHIADMVKDHEKDVAEFQKQSTSAQV
jgi:putative membrane protein